MDNVTATVTVTGQVASCDPEEAGSFGVTVFPTPQSEPSISSNGHLSCQDSTAFVTLTMLTANTSLEGVNGPGLMRIFQKSYFQRLLKCLKEKRIKKYIYTAQEVYDAKKLVRIYLKKVLKRFINSKVESFNMLTI